LDNDGWVDRFSEIEKKIERLIETCRSHENANLELHRKIKQLEEELHLRDESVRRHAEEKALIRSRIDNLLARLEDMTRS
jgi:septal ring factor EnvC (AmiA/AmiB activator)